MLLWSTCQKQWHDYSGCIRVLLAYQRYPLDLADGLGAPLPARLWSKDPATFALGKGRRLV